MSPVVLEGPKGTELQRLGTSVTAPWWTNIALLDDSSRERLRMVHATYRAAGASVTVANTFRCGERAVRAAGGDRDFAGTLVQRAVADARAALRDAPALLPDGEQGSVPGTAGGVVPQLAASIAPVEDCYRPDLVPPDDQLMREHGWLAAEIASTGVDFVLAETMNSIREAVAVTEACGASRLPVRVSFVCHEGGKLLSGEPVGAAARAVAASGAQAVLINCTALDALDTALDDLSQHSPVAIGAYPNLEDRSGIADWTPVDRHVPTALGPELFATRMAGLVDRYGLSFIGGCCGSTSAHVEALCALGT